MSEVVETFPVTLASVALETVGRAQRDAPFKAVLINPYELGRQPFALAEPAAWLKRAGLEVACIDLSLQTLDPRTLAGADLVAVYVGMHRHAHRGRSDLAHQNTRPRGSFVRLRSVRTNE
jgi:hypothetical protein